MEAVMSLEAFYEILSGICFALTGLWWTVVAGRKDWLKIKKCVAWRVGCMHLS